MNVFREAFRRTVEDTTEKLGVSPVWEKTEDRDLVILPKQNPDGFEVRLECMDYGVYPVAEGWEGGCYDVTIWKPEDLSSSLMEFIKSVVSDAELIVYYSNGKPYKWILHHPLFEGNEVFDETGSWLFNWFGKKTRKIYRNGSKAT